MVRKLAPIPRAIRAFSPTMQLAPELTQLTLQHRRPALRSTAPPVTRPLVKT
jgi:hypothetical protein